MSDFFLDSGLNWTWSKILPYLLFLLVGIGLFLFFKSKFRSKRLKAILSLIIIIPVSIYFAINPIYEGDFSNNFRELQKGEIVDLPANELTAIVIPGCPYCAESIGSLNKIAERTNAQSVNVIVITNDPNSRDVYEQLAHGKLDVSLVADFEKFNELTLGRFPTFVYADQSKLHVWSNDGFGVRAMDWVENQLLRSSK